MSASGASRRGRRSGPRGRGRRGRSSGPTSPSSGRGSRRGRGRRRGSARGRRPAAARSRRRLHATAKIAETPKNTPAPQSTKFSIGKKIVRPAHCRAGGNPATDFESWEMRFRSSTQRGSRRKENMLGPRKTYGRKTRTTSAAGTRIRTPRRTARPSAGPKGLPSRTRSTSTASPSGRSSASAVILQATARPNAIPVRASLPRPGRPCAMRTAPRSAAAEKVVR